MFLLTFSAFAFPPELGAALFRQTFPCEWFQFQQIAILCHPAKKAPWKIPNHLQPVLWSTFHSQILGWPWTKPSMGIPPARELAPQNRGGICIQAVQSFWRWQPRFRVGEGVIQHFWQEQNNDAVSGFDLERVAVPHLKKKIYIPVFQSLKWSIFSFGRLSAGNPLHFLALSSANRESGYICVHRNKNLPTFERNIKVLIIPPCCLKTLIFQECLAMITWKRWDELIFFFTSGKNNSIKYRRCIMRCKSWSANGLV